MSNSALIGFKFGKKVTFISCTNDGGVDVVGKALNRYWNGKELAESLVSHANIKTLKSSFKNTEFYESSDEDEKPQYIDNIENFVKTAIGLNKKYWYIWSSERWYYGNAYEEEYLFQLDSLLDNSRKVKR